MALADIHIHALYGVDDGARSEATMQKMIDAAYADGVRVLCVTPHFHPGYFGDNREKVAVAYKALHAYAAARHPAMRLFLGNEMRYSKDCLSWLSEGLCRTLGGADRVLVDFSEAEESKAIHKGLDRLLNGGYLPVLAHPERYAAIGNMREWREIRRNGVLLQVDAQSVFGGFGFGVKRRAKALLHEGLIDLAGSDAHGLTHRPPGMSALHEYIQKKHGTAYANAICYDNILRVLTGRGD